MEEWDWLAEGPAQDDSAPADAQSADDTVEALIEADRRNADLRRDAEYILFKREATRLADALEAKDDRPRVIRTMTQELELPDEPEIYAIDKLLPVGGNALFAGQYKAGKTTFIGQELKAWADGDLFLGRYACHPDPERPNLVMFNYELSEGQHRRWLRKLGIVNTDRIIIAQLRGHSWPIGLEKTRKEMAKILRDHGAGMWVLDPASRAMAGFGDGDKNGDVNAFTAYVDEIKAESGTRDCTIPIHMGHSAAKEEADQRALGAQAWSAWADALWSVTRDKNGNRWFRAVGRDVGVDKLLVQYDDTDMSVRLVEADEERIKEDKVRSAIIKCVTNEPGITGARLRMAVKPYISVRVQDVLDKLSEMTMDHTLSTQGGGGPGKAVHYFLPTDLPPLPGQPVPDD